MLILTRKIDESVLIGDDIKVMVVEVRPGQVRLGFEAPADVQIRRAELKPRVFAGSEHPLRVPPRSRND